MQFNLVLIHTLISTVFKVNYFNSEILGANTKHEACDQHGRNNIAEKRKDDILQI